MITRMKWTVEDYHQLIESGLLIDRHVELLEGEIVEMSPEGITHSFRGHYGANYLRALLKERADIRENASITLRDSQPEPDIAVVRLPIGIYLSHLPYAEDIYWLVEVSYSSLDKDLTYKQRIYAANGIPEYWIIDLQTVEIIVFREPEIDQYRSRTTFTDGMIYPLAFPDLAVSVEELLRGGSPS